MTELGVFEIFFDDLWSMDARIDYAQFLKKYKFNPTARIMRVN